MVQLGLPETLRTVLVVGGRRQFVLVPLLDHSMVDFLIGVPESAGLVLEERRLIPFYDHFLLVFGKNLEICAEEKPESLGVVYLEVEGHMDDLGVASRHILDMFDDVQTYFLKVLGDKRGRDWLLCAVLGHTLQSDQSVLKGVLTVVYLVDVDDLGEEEELGGPADLDCHYLQLFKYSKKVLREY